jgi:hypothetical protein
VNNSRTIPLIADILAVLLYAMFLPFLSHLFQKSSIFSAALIGLIYLIFCSGVYLGKKSPHFNACSNKSEWSGLLMASGIGLSIFISYMIAEAAGFFANLDQINADNPASAIMILVGVVIWLIFISIYPVILVIESGPHRQSSHWSSFIFQLPALLSINLMIVTTAVYWEVLLANTEPYTDLTVGAKLLIFSAAYLFFLFFFTGPRMLLLAGSSPITAWGGFLLQTGFYVWQTLSGTAWR